MSTSVTLARPESEAAAPGGAGARAVATPTSGRTSARQQGGELTRVLWTFRRELLWVCVFSFFANLLMLTPTLYMLQVFDRVMLSGSELTLLALTGFMVFFYLVMGLAEWLRSRLLVRAGARFDDAINTRVFNAAFEQRLNGATRNPLQPLTDLTGLRQFITGSGVFAVMDTPWTLVYLWVLFLMHPWLGWTAIAFSIVQMGMALAGHWLTSRRMKAAQDLTNDSNTYLQAKLRNSETVEALGMLDNLRHQWLATHERQLAAHADAQVIARRVLAANKFVQYMQQGLILAVGALLAIDGKISAGAMIACNALMGNALRPLGTIVQMWKQYVEASNAYRRLDQLLTAHPERADHHQADIVRGQISLRNLEASAPGRKTPILKGLTADLPSGEVIAILGPSGAGKSTLARCLLGIWPETQGDVLLDGHPIDEWSREALGPHVGYLPQDIELFDGTISENIARFTKASPEMVIDAARRTGIHDMILRLSKGYDTPMGEAGSLLSGGQRQRVGLARAILGNPTLVVLDEPNANLDEAGEQALARTVRDLKARGATVFMIVHHQHLLAVSDKVLMLENGQITRIVPVVIQTTPPTQSPQASA